MSYKDLKKIEIAEEQLFHAIELYLDGERLISSITLSGAAEEILGKLVNLNEQENALEIKVTDLCEMHETIFGEVANPKDYIRLRNKARNGLKHIGKESSISIDIEQEAVSLIRRGIKNYKLLNSKRIELFYKFEKESILRWRKITDDMC